MVLETHPVSRCCWCQQSLVRTEAVPFWTCAKPECAQRINAWNIAACDTDSKGKVKYTAHGLPKIRQMIFLPTPRATVFFEQQVQTKHTLFGGAKYVAKSFTLRWGAYRECMRIPGFKVLLLRRTFKQLELSHLLDMPAEAKQLELLGARYKDGDREFWIGDSLIKAGHCETTGDAHSYLSSSWDLIIFDEVVTFECETMFLPISSCARSTKPQVVAEGGGKVWAATNPGGRGAAWVPEFFIDKCPDPEKYPEYHPEEWSYVPGVLEDNPYAPKGYRQSLMNLPPILRRQWLYSDWSAFEGQFFEFMAKKDGQPWHVRDMGIAA